MKGALKGMDVHLLAVQSGQGLKERWTKTGSESGGGHMEMLLLRQSGGNLQGEWRTG